jgi:hypothetical protein
MELKKGHSFNIRHVLQMTNNLKSFSSSTVGTTNLTWVSACSTVVKHSQQEGFTECRYQWHV